MRDRLNSVSPALIAWGTPYMRPQSRPMAALAVAVLDVVVDEAEVVPELDRRGAGQRLAVIAGDRGVGQQAEEGTDALAAVRAGPVEREVVADHLVQAVGRGIAVLDEADDLAFGVGDELGEVQIGERRGHRGASVHETCSLAVACWRRTGSLGAGRRAREDDAGAGDATAPASTRSTCTRPRRIRPRSPLTPAAPPARRAVIPSRRDARPASLHHRSHRPVALRPGRGRPRADADHARRRQAQGDRQGRPPADVAPRRQPRAVRGADRRRSLVAGRSTSSPRSASGTPG